MGARLSALNGSHVDVYFCHSCFWQ